MVREERKEQLETALNEQIYSIGWGGRIETLSGRSFFLKEGKPSAIYACEVHGLQELRKSNTIQTAQVAAYGADYILTEYIPSATPKGDFYERFGRELAALHQTHADRFGFYEDNFIGDTMQLNLTTGIEGEDWAAFYYTKRLAYQFRLADSNGYSTRVLQRGMAVLEMKASDLLSGSEEKPTLLHGDLWNGNYLCDENNRPVLIDPAVYYGHREADLAMTYLFGGFPDEFYAAYHEAHPLPYGWEERIDLYKLYHLLNHLNLFSQGYLGESERIIRRYTGV